MAKLLLDKEQEEGKERRSSNRHDERSRKKKRSRSDIEGDRKERHHRSERHDRKNKDDDSSVLERPRKKHSKKNEHRHYSHSKHSSRHEHRKNHRTDEDEKESSRVAKQNATIKKKRKQHRHKDEVNSTTTNHLVPLGPVINVAPTTLLDPDADYFTYHSHLRLFLFRRRNGTYFEDLTSEMARQEFQRFVNEYNAGRLEQAYYQEQLPLEALEPCKRTKHTWKFHTTTKEMESLHLVKEGVRKQTDYKADSSSATTRMVVDPTPQIIINNVQSTGDMHKSSTDLATERRANRRLREHIVVAEEEMAGGKKDYGRERQLEIRQQRAEAQHGAARDRQDATVLELEDRELYGSDSFSAALAREKQRQAKLMEEKASRLLELQEKERQKQADMLKSIGLVGIQPGQKITIAPRTD